MKKVICKLIETDTYTITKERTFNAMDSSTQRSLIRSIKSSLGVSDVRHAVLDDVRHATHETGFILQLYGVRMMVSVIVEDVGNTTIEKKWQELRSKGSVKHEVTADYN